MSGDDSLFFPRFFGDDFLAPWDFLAAWDFFTGAGFAEDFEDFLDEVFSVDLATSEPFLASCTSGRSGLVFSTAGLGPTSLGFVVSSLGASGT